MAKSKSKRGRKLLVFSLIIVVVGGLAAAAFLRKREPVLTVQTEKVSRRNLVELVVANGRINPVFQVKISPEVSGEIIQLPVKEGQAVKKGDLLVQIRPTDYIAAKNSAEAGYKQALAGKDSATATLAKNKSEFDRYEALHKTGLVSDSDFQQAQMSFDVAKAQVESSIHSAEMAAAALKRANEDLLKTTILSPLDGTVSRLNSQLGERVVGTAMMAGTEIMTIADLNEMEARVDVGEIDVPLMKTGQVARLEVDAFKDRKFSGFITEIANSSKTSGAAGGGGSSTEATKFEVRIRIKDKEIFRPGMSVTAEIETRYRTNALAVPIASVTARLPKEAGKGKTDKSTNAPRGGKGEKSTNPPGGSANLAADPPAGTNEAATTNAATTNAAASTNVTVGGRKPGEQPKPIEVVFIREGDVARMVPVKRGISDDTHTEIIDGVKEGQEVVSGGFKAIARELEDGKKIKVGPAPSDRGLPGADKGSADEKR